MKHTFNEKRVTAMSQLEKEKQESKESKATVACSTERTQEEITPHLAFDMLFRDGV